MQHVYSLTCEMSIFWVTWYRICEVDDIEYKGYSVPSLHQIIEMITWELNTSTNMPSN